MGLIVGSFVLKPLFGRARPFAKKTRSGSHRPGAQRFFLPFRAYAHILCRGNGAFFWSIGSWAAGRWCLRGLLLFPGCICMCTTLRTFLSGWRWALHLDIWPLKCSTCGNLLFKAWSAVYALFFMQIYNLETPFETSPGLRGLFFLGRADKIKEQYTVEELFGLKKTARKRKWAAWALCAALACALFPASGQTAGAALYQPAFANHYGRSDVRAYLNSGLKTGLEKKL